MKKTINNILMGLMIFSAISYAKQGNVPDAPPEDNVQTMPDQNQPEGTPLIGDDPMNDPKFDKGDYYNINLGTATKNKEIGEDGQDILKDNDGNIIIQEEKANDLDPTYRDKYNQVTKRYYKQDPAYKNGTDAEKEAIRNTWNNKLKEAKEERRNEVKRKGYNQANSEKLFLEGMKSAGKGTGVAGKMLMHREGETEAEANVTNFYQQNYTSRPYNNSKLKLRESNANILIDAYDQVDNIQTMVESHLDATTIRCSISRELIPAFYCPIAGKQDTKYPDFVNGGAENSRLLSSEEAEKVCNSECKVKQACKSNQIIGDKIVKFPSLNGKKIYPSRDQPNGFNVLTLNDDISTRLIKFDVVIHKSDNFDGNETEFKEYIRKHPLLKFKYSIFNKPTDTRLLPEIVVDRATVVLNETKLRLTIPIYRQTDRIVLQTYRAHMYASDVWDYKRVGEAEFLANIGTVTIENVEAEYAGDSLYFCPTRQFVPNEDACPRSVKQYNMNGQLYYICLDNEHMIGEDRKTGGFFTESSCENSCYSRMECKPTYEFYKNITDKKELFKAEIDCVKEKGNVGCQKSTCVALFKDNTIMPQEELIIQNDNEREYTVKDSIITDVPRPKIDVEAEESALTESEYKETFKKEMKDAAYKEMIESQTFNRVKYKIGEVSPSKVAYMKNFKSTGTIIRGKLKPESNKFDNGIVYDIYSVMVVEELFPAAYGKYTRPGYDGDAPLVLDAENDVVIIKDKTYLIKTNVGWEVFRKELNHSIKAIIPYVWCPGEPAKKYDGDIRNPQLSQEEKDAGCYLTNKTNWIEMPSYKKVKNEKYNTSLQRFETFSLAETAPAFISEEFISDIPIKEYDLVSTIESVTENVAGCFIRDQITNDNGVSLTRIYDTSVAYNGDNRGRIANIQIYLFSGNNLSYDTILNIFLKKENRLFDYINQQESPRIIEDDGEINNNITPFIMGLPEKTTLSVKIKPNIDEEHKRVFKFIFLFNETPDN